MTDIEETVQYLLKICRVGRWLRDYVLLRCLGRLNIFPGNDVGAARDSNNIWVLRKGLTTRKLKDHIAVATLCRLCLFPFLSTN